MELVEVIHVRFIETAMKVLMRDALVSLKRENKRRKSDEDDFPSIYPDDFMILPSL